ncbi:MAG: glycoside hydrolase family 13 protein [Candidatus Xenobia bacterium]
MRWLALVLILLACVMPGLADSSSPVPEWAKRAVWYQIFPERFYNGDPTNDPKLEDQRGAWPHDVRPPWQVHPWTSDWYELQPYEKANHKDIWFNLQRRRYGGDLQGVIDKLDYLQDLGVNAIYLNPVFESPSSHKYDATVYHHVDPTFGPDPEGDRRIIASENPGDPSTWQWTAADRLALKLIHEVHARHMHVIFDGVFNHIGMTSPFFLDVQQRLQASPYADWFKILSFEPFRYEGWYGVKELPEWRQDANGLVAGPRGYVFAVTRRWMAPNRRVEDGIDGWRLDVAYLVKHPFWKAWHHLVRSINPQAYTTAEIIDTVDANKPYLQGDEFSAVMNYNFAFAASEFFIDRKHRIKVSEFDSKLRTLREAYPAEVAYGMQNLLDSHDTARLASMIVNRDLVEYRDWPHYCELAKGSNLRFSTRAPGPGDLQLQKLMALFQMTYVGAPMIYYGDEAGMWGATDPDCRQPMLWPDMHFAPAVMGPDGHAHPPDPVAFNRDLFDTYRHLIHIRRDQDALQLGDFHTLVTDDAHHVYAFSRTWQGQTIIVALNPTNQPQTVTVPSGSYLNLLDGASLSGPHAVVLPQWGLILKPTR